MLRLPCSVNPDGRSCGAANVRFQTFPTRSKRFDGAEGGRNLRRAGRCQHSVRGDIVEPHGAGRFVASRSIPIRRGNATVGQFKCPRSSAGIDDRGHFRPGVDGTATAAIPKTARKGVNSTTCLNVPKITTTYSTIGADGEVVTNTTTTPKAFQNPAGLPPARSEKIEQSLPIGSHSRRSRRRGHFVSMFSGKQGQMPHLNVIQLTFWLPPSKHMAGFVLGCIIA